MNDKKCKICNKDYKSLSNNSCYCSEKCARIAQSKKINIEKIQARVKGINKYKWKIVNKYGCRCAVCGYTRYANFKQISSPTPEEFPHIGLGIHHIIPISKGGDDEENNLILLCPNCHKEAHDGVLSEDFLFSLSKNNEDLIGDIFCLTGINGASDILFGEITYKDKIQKIAEHFNVYPHILSRIFNTYRMEFYLLNLFAKQVNKKNFCMIIDGLKNLAYNYQKHNEKTNEMELEK